MLTFKTVFHGTVWGAKRTVNLTQNPQLIPHFRQEDTRTDRPSQEYDLAAQEPPCTNPQPNFGTALLCFKTGVLLQRFHSSVHDHQLYIDTALLQKQAFKTMAVEFLFLPSGDLVGIGLPFLF